MNFDWNEEQKQLSSAVKQALTDTQQQELAALPGADMTQARQTLLDGQSALAGTGYLSLAAGPDAAADWLTLMAGQEVLSKISGPLFLCAETTARFFGGLIKGYANDSLAASLMNKIEAGSIIAGVALSESGALPGEGGFTQAVEESDGFVLNGAKDYVTNGPIADHFAVYCFLGGKPAFAIIDKDQAGLSVGLAIDTLGAEGLAVGPITMKGLRISKDRLIGPFEGDGPLSWLRLVEALVLAQSALGLSGRLFDATKDRAKSHERAGRPVAHKQSIGFRLSEMFTALQASEFINRRACWAYARNNDEKITLAHAAKIFSSESAEKIASISMSIWAGKGFEKGNAAEIGWREAKLTAISGTSNELARHAIAEQLLKRYRV